MIPLELRTIMVDNIEKILERGDRIELLVDKTATMQDSVFHFRKQSKRLRRALWMKNAKLLDWLPNSDFKTQLSSIFSPKFNRTAGSKRLLGVSWKGLVDMSFRTLSLLDNRCLLWRHHSTFLQIITSDGHFMVSDQSIMATENKANISLTIIENLRETIISYQFVSK
ncbi:hypothetical protein K7X08_028025 [Anisodus acutangulus]|uniref:V-SNARE coiled-coil homology domain-containing protein n=2 Tax=Anisodus TaxID=243963 RepID=A0A9Q1MU24_9SOLA|nr:hypothetical protein K7X08_028025 [Anisodus acutangulus]